MKLFLNINKNLLLSLFLLAALVLSIWATRASISAYTYDEEALNTKDTFMTDVKYTSYDDQGEWESSFYSPHIDHYRSNDIAYLDSPVVNTKGKDSLVWQITASKATSHGGKTIQLNHDVVIERTNQNSDETTELHTTKMALYPKEKILVTKEPVKIKQPGSIVEAIGLTADLNTGDIQLTSDTKSIYIPPSS